VPRTAGTDEDLQRAYFDEGYRPALDRWTRLHDRRNAARVVREVLRFVPGGSVLEVGPGRGHVLAALREAGFTVRGADLSRSIALDLKGRLGIDVHTGPLSDLVAAGEQAQVVLLLNVLEHFSDPGAELAIIRRLLAPGGVLYVAVPNWASWDARLRGWTSYEPYHLSYFTPRSLHDTLERAGFEVIQTTCPEGLTGWSNALVRTAFASDFAIQPPTAGAPSSVPRESVARSVLELARLGVGVVLTPFRALQTAARRGEEIVAVARSREDKTR
jgi:2-polyprenyl-3-methyl-5-hydroxy-6-metoxy-1,4-benzoquinol methylase